MSLVGEDDRKVLKLAIKNSQDQVKQRVVPSELIFKYRDSIESLSDTVEEILFDEKEEKKVTPGNVHRSAVI